MYVNETYKFHPNKGMSWTAHDYLILDALVIWSGSRDHTPAHYKRDGTECAGALH